MIGDLVISLLGLLIGTILAKLSPEELSSGKKYFLIARSSLLGLIQLEILSFFLWQQLWTPLILLLLLSVIILIGEIKFPSKLARLLPYLLFVIAYMINPDLFFRQIHTLLIFLYGLPTGTLLHYDS